MEGSCKCIESAFRQPKMGDICDQLYINVLLRLFSVYIITTALIC
jgi:hypothetical protein